MRSYLLVGVFFTFAMTVLGAASVFFFRNGISDRAERMSLGFAGGVMSAAAVFSLLLPAIERQAALGGSAPWKTAVLGFAAGMMTMIALEALMARGRAMKTDDEARRHAMLLGAVTLHNIPEGMAVGLAFTSLGEHGGAALAAAAAVALGIGLQNIPEGAAIALPLYQGGMSRKRSFAYGAASGAVEPVFGLLAACFAASVSGVMPGLMAFSAGAMMWVVFCEMLPEAGRRRDGAVCAAAGYVLMMALDLALG